MSASRVELEVSVFGGHEFVGSLMFTAPSISVGRAPDAMVRLDDPDVSLKHAVLFFVGETYCIKDLGSRTGTRVNGAPADPRRPVLPTDDIEVGPFHLRITLREEGAAKGAGPTSRWVAAGTNRESVTGLYVNPVAPVAPVAQSVTPLPDRQTSARREEPRGFASPKGLGSLPPPVAPPMSRSVRPDPARPDPVRPDPARPDPVRPDPVRRTPAKADVEPPPVTFTPARRDRDGDWDEDEDDDAVFVPAFDLLDALCGGGLASNAVNERASAVELVRYQGDRVVSVRHFRSRGALRLPGSRVVFGRRKRDGSCWLNPKVCGNLEVRDNGRALSPAESSILSGGKRLKVTPGLQVTLDLDGAEKLLVHLVPRVADVPRPPVSARPSKERLTSGAVSAGMHVVGLLSIGLFVLKGHESLDINQGRFATISLKEIELEPAPGAAPPPPPPETTATAEKAPVPTAKAPVAQPPARKQPVTTATKSPPTTHDTPPAPAAPERPAQSTQQALTALGSLSPSSLSATAITNLDAAPRSSTGGGYKLSGAIGKAPGDNLRIAPAGSGGGQLDTKSATEVGSNVGRVEAKSSGGPVRARVTAVPQAIRGEGQLDRGEIQKVVNAHVHQVQGCYERQLMKDPSLSGKITLEWVIDLSGGVTTVRVRQSTVRSSEVASCIQSAIRGWRFPSPQGGTVTVTYPFAFSTVGN